MTKRIFNVTSRESEGVISTPVHAYVMEEALSIFLRTFPQAIILMVTEFGSGGN